MNILAKNLPVHQGHSLCYDVLHQTPVSLDVLQSNYEKNVFTMRISLYSFSMYVFVLLFLVFNYHIILYSITSELFQTLVLIKLENRT